MTTDTIPDTQFSLTFAGIYFFFFLFLLKFFASDTKTKGGEGAWHGRELWVYATAREPEHPLLAPV